MYEGDEIICDVTSNERGIVVSEIQEVSKIDRPLLLGQIVKFFGERGYGFVHIPQTGVDAFFHFHLLSQGQRADLFEGKELQVEVTTDSQGRAQVRKIIDEPSFLINGPPVG